MRLSLTILFLLKMRIVNQAKELAVRFLHCGDHVATADFGDWFVNLTAMRDEMIDYSQSKSPRISHYFIYICTLVYYSKLKDI